MLVRLTAKLAEVVNDLDLTHCLEGDVIEVTDRDGAMLIAEGWAERTGDTDVATCEPAIERDVAADEGAPARSAASRRKGLTNRRD
jgi:hypothetical protein